MSGCAPVLPPSTEDAIRRIVREELEREREIWITRFADIEFVKKARVGIASDPDA